MSAYPVQVGSIAPTTTEQTLHDFFTFCGKGPISPPTSLTSGADSHLLFLGKIDKIEFDREAKSATIYFEKLSAAKTALMLNGAYSVTDVLVKRLTMALLRWCSRWVASYSVIDCREGGSR